MNSVQRIAYPQQPPASTLPALVRCPTITQDLNRIANVSSASIGYRHPRTNSTAGGSSSSRRHHPLSMSNEDDEDHLHRPAYHRHASSYSSSSSSSRSSNTSPISPTLQLTPLASSSRSASRSKAPPRSQGQQRGGRFDIYDSQPDSAYVLPPLVLTPSNALPVGLQLTPMPMRKASVLGGGVPGAKSSRRSGSRFAQEDSDGDDESDGEGAIMSFSRRR